MQRRLTLVIVVLAVIVAGGVLAIGHTQAPSASAQAADRQPLLYNEIEGWCDACGGSLSDLPDGYVRLVVNADSYGSLDSECPRMAIPEGVEGWASIQSAYGGLPERPTYPTGATQEEIHSADATAVAAAGNPVYASFTIDQARSQPDAAVCELVVRRSQ
jgi:hypothetical protein